MKLKNIRQLAMGLFIASLAIIQFGCEQDWQKDFKSSTLASPNAATVSVNTIKDSTAMLDYSISTVGRLYIAIVPGDDETATPDPQKMLKLSVADAVFSKQVVFDDASSLSATIKVAELEQNTSYKVFVLPVNSDGVLGSVATTDAFKTSDTYKPQLDLDENISPAMSSTAAQSSNFSISLTFDEPVVLAANFDIQIGYRNAETGDIDFVAVSKDSISVKSNVVTIKQMSKLLNGQYVFLTIGQNSIQDRSGNGYDGVTSGIVSGKLVGIYWRVALENKGELAVLPTDTVLVTDPSILQVIKLVYPYNLSAKSLGGYDNTNIVVKYSTSEGSEEFYVSSGNLNLNDDTLEISIPRLPNYGETMTFMINSGALYDVYGNDIDAVKYGDYSWFISYGYTRDKIIGNYGVHAISYYGGSSDFAVTIAAKAGSENGVVITGLFDSSEPLEGVFNGDLATLTIAGGQSFGDLIGDGSEVFLSNGSDLETSVVGTILSDASINLNGWGGYISGGTYDGYFYDYYSTSVWSKTSKKQDVVKNFIPALKKLN